MNRETTAPQSLAQRIDTIEEVYEFMLAFAAQGRQDEGENSGSDIRAFLKRADAALEGLTAAAAESARRLPAAAAYEPFIDVLGQDVKKAQAAVRLVLAHRSIGSQIIDNLNASIHLRALLTDLFLIDESLKGEVT